MKIPDRDKFSEPEFMRGNATLIALAIASGEADPPGFTASSTAAFISTEAYPRNSFLSVFELSSEREVDSIEKLDLCCFFFFSRLFSSLDGVIKKLSSSPIFVSNEKQNK